MTTAKDSVSVKQGEPGRVAFLDGQGEMPMLQVSTAWSSAEIYTNGAHVTYFRKNNEAPLLFMSQCSRFEHGQPIRGGIPVIFPWFGAKEGLPQHGFARIKEWALKEVVTAPDGSVTVVMRLPDCPEASMMPPFTADFAVTVKDSLSVKLSITNNSAEEVLAFENCLHTYFEVSDSTAITVRGLKGAEYLDKVANFARKTEMEEAIQIRSEVDRVYLNTKGTVEIADPRLGRIIRVEKDGSNSTVVWNPWIAKAQQMPDFGNEEYTKMICVESGNVAENEIKLPPGETAVLAVRLSTRMLI